MLSPSHGVLERAGAHHDRLHRITRDIDPRVRRWLRVVVDVVIEHVLQALSLVVDADQDAPLAMSLQIEPVFTMTLDAGIDHRPGDSLQSRLVGALGSR